MKKSKMLKVASILIIIFSALQIALSIVDWVSVFQQVLQSEQFQMTDEYLAMILMNTVLFMVIAVYQLIVGILGIVSFDKPEKGYRCFVLGIITMVLVLAKALRYGFPRSLTSLAEVIWGMFLFMVFSILYTVGSYQLMQMQRRDA